MLRAVTIDIGPLDSKFLGLVAMGAAIAILFVLPWLDRARVNSMRYKGDIARVMLMVFAAMFVVLGYLGVKAPSEGRTLLAQIATVFYFAYFITMPIWTSTHVKRTSIVSWIICAVFGVIFLVMTFQNLGGDVPFLVRLLSFEIGRASCRERVKSSVGEVGVEQKEVRRAGDGSEM